MSPIPDPRFVRALLPPVSAALRLRPARPPRRGDTARALAATLAMCVGAGLATGIIAGAVSGTLVVPVLGTIYGFAIGAVAAVPGTVVLAPVILIVLGVRHRPSVAAEASCRLRSGNGGSLRSHAGLAAPRRGRRHPAASLGRCGDILSPPLRNGGSLRSHAGLAAPRRGRRHPAAVGSVDPERIERDLAVVFTAAVAVLGAAAYAGAIVAIFNGTHRLLYATWIVGNATATLAVLVVCLRVANAQITAAWLKAHGWSASAPSPYSHSMVPGGFEVMS